MILVFFGPPGAGKGTVAERLASEESFLHVSTGDLFRAAVKEDSDLGRQVKEITASGSLVPDSITVALVRERLAVEDDSVSIILDGFPRTEAQADALADFAPIDKVINFAMEDEGVIARLTGRRTCRQSGHTFHVEFMPPKKEGVCDFCGGELYTREDDAVAAVRNRLQVYRKQTQPLINYYRAQNLLADIDATGTPDQVYTEALAAIETLRD